MKRKHPATFVALLAAGKQAPAQQVITANDYAGFVRGDGHGWAEILLPCQTSRPNLQFIQSASSGHKFYRLHKP